MKALNLLVFCCVLLHLSAQDLFDQRFYNTYVHPIESKNSSDSNFNDLHFLKSLVQNKQLIILGEAGHGDGTAFEMKTRIIKYLNQEMGYNTVIFEGGGFLEMNFIQDTLLKHLPLNDLIRNSWFNIWSNSKQCNDLIEYMANNPSKISFAGMENQAGTNYWLESPKIMYRLGGEQLFENIDFDNFELNFTTFYYNNFVYYKDSLPYNEADFITSIKSIQHNAQTVNTKNAQIIDQTLVNLLGFIEQLKLANGDYNQQNNGIELRDSLMVQNVLWWLKQHPNEKAIIWTANLHGADKLELAQYKPNDNFYQEINPFCEQLKTTLGQKVYSIAITASTGEVYNMYENKNEKIQAEQGTLEFELGQKIAYDFAYVDFNSARKLKRYKNKRFNTIILGYSNKPGQWMEMFDGIVFIRTMEPSERIN